MRSLHVLLVIWLTVAVPTAALASLVNEGHCQRKMSAPSAAMDHSHHASAQHLQHAAHASPGMQGGCQCDCDCSGHHCVSGCSGFLTVARFSNEFSTADAAPLAYHGPVELASAHHLDLLRPPSLT